MMWQGCSEWEAFHAVVLWAAGGAALDEVERLLALVRYPLMSGSELEVRRGAAWALCASPGDT